MNDQSVKDDNVLIEALTRLSISHPHEGFWKYYYRLRNEDLPVNHKRVHHLYKKMGLSLRRKSKKRLPSRVIQPGKPTQNAYIERFNKTYRQGVGCSITMNIAHMMP